MRPEQKSLRIGAAVIIFAVLLRLFSGGLLSKLSQIITDPRFSAAMLYASTGKVFSLQNSSPAPAITPEITEPEPTEPTAAETEPEPMVQAVFSADDTALVSMTNYPGYSFDMQALLTTPISWNLTSEAPTVLILHSHASESYENTEGYTPSGSYRTTDNRYNMISVGEYLAQCLRQKGISVLHDTTVHDYPSYNAAYTLSRQTAAEYLEKYPSIRLVLDIHRDAYADKNGNQISNTVTVDGKTVSRLMLVAGTNAYGESHADWQKNLSFALKLQTTMERLYPGLCRPLALRSSAFNQDLSPGALLIEIGTAGDSREQALGAAKLLADGIAALAYGSTSA